MILKKYESELRRNSDKRLLPRITERIVQSSRALMMSDDIRCKGQFGISATEGEDIKIA